MKWRSLILVGFMLLMACSAANAQKMDKERLELIDSVIVDAILQKTIPGAVVGIVKDGKMVYSFMWVGREVNMAEDQALFHEVMESLQHV